MSRVRALHAALLLSSFAFPVRAQSSAQSLDAVVRLVSSRASADRILELLRTSCITFIADDSAQIRLRTAGADTALLRGLGSVCYVGTSLEVLSEPPGAEIWIGQRMVGKTPWAGPYRPATQVAVEARFGKTTRTALVDIPQNNLTRVRFNIPSDTLLWPAGRSGYDFARSLNLAEQYQSRIPKPLLPPEPTSWSKLKFWFGGAVIGGAIAFGGTIPLCTVYDETRIVAGKEYGGEPLGLHPYCSMGASGGGAMVGSLFSLFVGKKRFNGRVRRYEVAKMSYPQTLAAWDAAKAAERETFFRLNPRIKVALDSQARVLLPEVNRTQAENANILARNSSLPRLPIIEQLAVSPILPGGGVITLATGPAVDVDTNIPRGRQRNPRAIAVVIGNRQYQKADVPPVEFAQRDAESVKQYLTTTLGFADENIIYAVDASAARLQSIFGTAQNAQGQLANFIRTPDSTDVFVYYSGHGAPDVAKNTAYLVPSDADPNFINLAGYPVSLLYQNLAKLKARSLTVVIDACFSGIADKGSLLKGDRPLGLEVEFPLLTAENAALFAAGRSEQIATSYEEKRHGLFTYFFLKGMQGAADTDGDSQITYRELGAYVNENVSFSARRLKNRTQTPQMISRASDRVLLSLPARR